MKRILIIITFTFLSNAYIISQNKHALGVGLDLSTGPHYYSKKINNPLLLALNVNYNFTLKKYVYVGAGFKTGGFSHSISSGVEEYKRYSDLYKGNVFSPFITLGVKYNLFKNEKLGAYHFIFVENNLSYDIMKLNKYFTPVFQTSKEIFNYQIKLGYQYPLNNVCVLSFHIGYSTLDYSRIDRGSILVKSSTPLVLGLSMNFI